MRAGGGEAGCPAGSRCPGDRPRPVLAPGGAQRGRGGHSQRGQVRVCPGPLGRSPAPAVLGRARRGGGGGTPRLPAPGWAAALPPTPPPAPCPLPAAWWRWDPGVPSEWRGPQAVTVLPGVLVYSGLGLRGLLLLRRPALLRRLGPPAPHRMALTRALAGCGAGRAGASESWGPSNGKFVLQTQRSLCPQPCLTPLPRALAPAWLCRPGATSGSAPQGARLRFSAGSAGHGDSLQFVGGGVSLSPERRRC